MSKETQKARCAPLTSLVCLVLYLVCLRKLMLSGSNLEDLLWASLTGLFLWLFVASMWLVLGLATVKHLTEMKKTKK